MGLGKKLQELMDERGLKQADLCRAADISPSTLSSIIVRDNSKLSIDVFLRICKVLNCKPEYFSSEITEPASDKSLEELIRNPETLEFMRLFEKISREEKMLIIGVMKAFLK